jgi:hypothetical protein
MLHQRLYLVITFSSISLAIGWGLASAKSNIKTQLKHLLKFKGIGLHKFGNCIFLTPLPVRIEGDQILEVIIPDRIGIPCLFNIRFRLYQLFLDQSEHP